MSLTDKHKVKRQRLDRICEGTHYYSMSVPNLPGPSGTIHPRPGGCRPPTKGLAVTAKHRKHCSFTLREHIQGLGSVLAAFTIWFK
ncbi:C-terminal-binding protein 2 [Liparis tanakae]|uniref:C-terminal-binding protein 2 n=1 Tax=Liparis tanakae TaxID=230148 RepID=A0A4Z2I703_9TELE|nr:C-terminal-binding protein 2 [Liparis tanakae]